MMGEVDVIAVGRAGLDLYAQQIGVPFEEIRSFAAYVGGTPANIAVGLSRLGARSAVLTAVSDDPVGDFIVRSLSNEGVETRFVKRKAGYKTGLVLLGIDPPDHFPRVHYRHDVADQHLDADDVASVPFGRCRTVVVVGTSLTHSPGREATLHAAELGRAAGAEIVIDLDYRPDLWGERSGYASAIKGLLRFGDVVIGTSEELNAAVPNPGGTDEAARLILEWGSGVVIEKLGADGCRVFARGCEPSLVEGYPANVRNTLGAGDAFAAGFLYGRLRGWDLRRAARWGNACGAIVVERHACSSACPTIEEVERFVGGDRFAAWFGRLEDRHP